MIARSLANATPGTSVSGLFVNEVAFVERKGGLDGQGGGQQLRRRPQEADDEISTQLGSKIGKNNISLVILLSREIVYIRKQFLYLCNEKSVWLSPDALFHFSVTYNSCRQVLTTVNNSQLLLKLPILDKFRLVTFHTYATQRSYNVRTGIHLVQEK